MRCYLLGLFYWIVLNIYDSLQVRSAEAEAEAKYLSGVSVARQCKAIVDGLRTLIVLRPDCLSSSR